MKRSCVAATVVAALAAATVRADDSDSHIKYVLTGPVGGQPGDTLHYVLTTGLPTTAFLMFSLGDGPTLTNYGSLCLDFPLFFYRPVKIGPSGSAPLDLNVPTDLGVDCIQFYEQYLICNQGGLVRGVSNALSTLVFEDSCGVEKECPETAFTDPTYGQYPGGYAIALPTLGGRFFFVDQECFLQLPDGTAQLSGVIEAEGHPENRYFFQLSLGDEVIPGMVNYPPAGSPKKELADGAYVENGGPIDTNTWRYFTTCHGKLDGLEANLGKFASFDCVGPAFQVGVGANGKNVNFGASGWIAGTFGDGTAFSGDGNIDLSDCTGH